MQATQEESSTESPKIKNFPLNIDNKGLMTCSSLSSNPSLIDFLENNTVC